MVALCVIGLCAGHLLAGPAPGDQTTLALSTAARHPGVALAIARANFPGETLVAPAVLLYVLLNVIVSLPYTKWAAGRNDGNVDVARRVLLRGCYRDLHPPVCKRGLPPGPLKCRMPL